MCAGYILFDSLIVNDNVFILQMSPIYTILLKF